MMTRIDFLNSLLKFDQPLSEVTPLLNSFSWDSKGTLVTLKKDHIINILKRYLSNQLSSSDIEDWANAIEGREDIEYERDFEEIIEEAIYELANPFLTSSLSRNLAQKWIDKLTRYKISV
jgi:hypothetical protein